MADSVPTLGDQWAPCIVLENDRPEYHYLANSILFGGQAVLINTPGAAHNFFVQLINPSNSGVLAVVDLITVFQSISSTNIGPATYFISRWDTPLANLHLDQQVRDTRWDVDASTNRRGACQLRSELDATFTPFEIGMTVYTYSNTGGSTSFHAGYYDRPIILAPGAGVLCHCAGQTAQENRLRTAFSWRERKLTEWEQGGILT